MTIRAVIWDMGGVLVRTEDYTSREALASRLGKTRVELEEVVFGREAGRKAQLGQISFDQHWQYLCRQWNLPDSEIPKLQAEFWGGDLIDTSLLDYIRSLRPDYKIGLLSNAFSDLRTQITQKWEFGDIFDQIVVSAEEGVMKPDAAIYRVAVNRLGVQADEAVFIDDMLHNVTGAQAAGLYAIQFKNREQVQSDLNALLETNS